MRRDPGSIADNILDSMRRASAGENNPGILGILESQSVISQLCCQQDAPHSACPCGDAISRAVGELVSWAAQGKTRTGQGVSSEQVRRSAQAEAEAENKSDWNWRRSIALWVHDLGDKTDVAAEGGKRGAARPDELR